MSSVTGIFSKSNDNSHEKAFEPKPYSNPYLVGIGLGLVLLAAFVIMGRGLGASGAISTLVAVGVEKVAPEHTANNSFYEEYKGDGTTNPLKDWLLFQIIGVIAGGFISGALTHRNNLTIEKGPQVSNTKRLIMAFIGGGFIGFGAKMARGCMSGQALSGGAFLNLGSWAAMLAIFVGGYALAYFVRRQWI